MTASIWEAGLPPTVTVPPTSPFRNRLINGAMRHYQRFVAAPIAVGTATPTYALDRWYGFRAAAAGAFTMHWGFGSDGPPGFPEYAEIVVTTADASIAANDIYLFRQVIEGYNITDFLFGTSEASSIALSFWVRSTITGKYGAGLRNGTGTRCYVFSFTIENSNSWERKTVIIPGDTIGEWVTDSNAGLSLTFSLGAGSDYHGLGYVWSAGLQFQESDAVNLISTNGAVFSITGLQLEKGDVVSEFEYRNYGDELLRCKRYYQTNPPTAGWTINATTINNAPVAFSPTMRATPSAALTLNVIGTVVDSGVAFRNVTGHIAASLNYNGGDVSFLITNSTPNKMHTMYSGVYGFSAELT